MRPLVPALSLVLLFSLPAGADIAPPRIVIQPSGTGMRAADPEPSAGGIVPGRTVFPDSVPDSAPAAPPTAEEIAATHDALRRLKATMENALNAQALDTLLENVTDDVLFTTMNGDVVRGPDEVRAYFERMMQGDDAVVESVITSFEADDLSLLVRRDVAVAFGSTDDHYVLADGSEMAIAARWTATLVEDDGDWKVQAFHYSTNMFDNPVLDRQRSLMLMIGILGSVVLFALAFWIGRKLGARAARKAVRKTGGKDATTATADP